MTNTSIQDIDLTDTQAFVRGEIHELWARLRLEDPVHWNPTPEGGFWALTTYQDVQAGLRDFETFSSEGGTVIGGSYQKEQDTAARRMLVTSDPPKHRQLRKRMQRLFTPTIIERVACTVDDLLQQAMEKIWQDGGGDFAKQVAIELPVGALMAQMAIGHDDALRLVQITRAMIGYRDPDFEGGIDNEALRLAGLQADVFDFFMDLIEQRRVKPGEDAVSILLTPGPGERVLDEESLLLNLMNLAIGGNETTQHSASGGVLELASDPVQWDLLRRNPELVSTGVEEFVRWTSTASYVQRMITQPVQVRDKELLPGDLVTLWIASANRDEAVFSNPGRFDLGRTPNRHLGFASGPHHCIGAAFGRSGLRSLLEDIRRRPGRLKASGEPVRLRSNFMLEYKSVPVEVVG